MTPFWSAWIMFLVVLNLGITLFLFLWGQRVAIPTLADGTSGHVWAHGVLKEGIRKLPLWWVLISLAMFITGFTYLALYPGFGSFKGMLGWTAHGELATDLAANRSKLDPLLQRVAVQPVETIARDAEATLVGQRLFIDNCAACHGNEGHGNHLVGAPNLIDGDWLYGGSGDAILASIQDGRMGVMPPMGASFDAASFALCAACHGPTGTGNQALGAPDLTDHVWLYGGDNAAIERTIRDGRSGVMPAWRTRLSDTDARMIAAWVYEQSRSQAR